MAKGKYIDFAELANERSSFVRISRRRYTKDLCAVCFRPKTACHSTGEAEEINGQEPKEKTS